MRISGLIGKKIGMTRLFIKYNNNNKSVPVTVIQVEPNYVTQIKYFNRDGYSAIQVTTGKKKINKIIKSEVGHFLKSNILVGRGLWEFRITTEEEKNIFVGDTISLDVFREIKKVDVTGISKGKGFSGTIKRWNFHSQDSTHGNSLSHRAPGSIGQNQTPGRVFKGKKMAGQLGMERVTLQNLDVVSIDLKTNVLLVKGAVPGEIGGDLIIKSSVKNN